MQETKEQKIKRYKIAKELFTELLNPENPENVQRELEEKIKLCEEKIERAGTEFSVAVIVPQFTGKGPEVFDDNNTHNKRWKYRFTIKNTGKEKDSFSVYAKVYNVIAGKRKENVTDKWPDIDITRPISRDSTIHNIKNSLKIYPTGIQDEVDIEVICNLPEERTLIPEGEYQLVLKAVSDSDPTKTSEGCYPMVVPYGKKERKSEKIHLEKAPRLAVDVEQDKKSSESTTQKNIEEIERKKELNKDRELDRIYMKIENLKKEPKRSDKYKHIIIGKNKVINIIGESDAIKEIIVLLRTLEKEDIAVFIQGESGTGKESIAKAIHYNSVKKEGQFIGVNCAAIPETLIESELFGHEKGAFTDAASRRKGMFELADGGTIFLDEIGDMSLPAQAMLLRILQEKEFKRVGGEDTIEIDVRVIAATNIDLKDAIKTGTFRPDLFYRLNKFPIKIPPLREQREDIYFLVNHFLEKYGNKSYYWEEALAQEAKNKLLLHDWNGNTRELENTIERAVILAEGRIIREEDLMLEHCKDTISNREQISIKDAVKNTILNALRQTKGNRTAAAKLLDMKQNTFYNNLRKYNLQEDIKNLFPKIKT